MALRRKRLWLALGFTVALLLTAIFAMRLSVSLGVWSAPPPDQPVAGWMTPRYVARSHGIPPEVMVAVLDLARDGSGRRITLAELAEARGEPLTDLIATVEAAIAAEKAARGD